jgi:ABC-type phosphate/phosphonate transport system substrate-binding protein
MVPAACQWLRSRGLDFDYVLYSNYERQVEELLAGRIDGAWNSPLAWVRAQRLGDATGVPVEALTMRDSDRDLTSVVVVRADSGISRVSDLDDKIIATGAIDSRSPR